MTPPRQTRAMCWWTSRSRPTLRILAIACAPGRRATASAISRLTIVLLRPSKAELDGNSGRFTGIFTNADGNLFAKRQPAQRLFLHRTGNYALNLRKLYLLNTNYADLSFLFTILPGEKTNAHPRHRVLAVLETDKQHPYFLNLITARLHTRLILG